MSVDISFITELHTDEIVKIPGQKVEFDFDFVVIHQLVVNYSTLYTRSVTRAVVATTIEANPVSGVNPGVESSEAGSPVISGVD